MDTQVTTSPGSPYLISYREMKRKVEAHPIFASEIPTEHYTSHLIPTRRLGTPGYAGFASPARRMAGRRRLQGIPDRWWVLSAQNAQLLLFARTIVQPLLTENAPTMEIELPRPPISVTQLEQLGADIDEKLETLAVAFFAENGEGNVRQAEDCALVRDALRLYLPKPLWPHYEALAPDFFAWLFDTARTAEEVTRQVP